MDDKHDPAGILSCVLTLASHAGFEIRHRHDHVTGADAASLVDGDLETFLDFAVTDGELTFTLTQGVSEILVDPTLTLARLGKLAAALTEFTFGE
jgi:hypothetical protein